MYRNADTENIVIPPDRMIDGVRHRAMVDRGYHYVIDGELVAFIDDKGQNYCGLLAGDGSPLPDGAPVVFLWFQRDLAQ